MNAIIAKLILLSALIALLIYVPIPAIIIACLIARNLIVHW